MELSQRSFFDWIKFSWPYTSLEMHNHIAFFTDNFNLKKLNLLKNDFESFLRFERSQFSKRFSIEDIDNAILKFNSDKEEKIVYENLSSDEKLDLVEKLLCPNEFYFCYSFLDTLTSEIRDHKDSPKDYSIYNLKATEIKPDENLSPSVNESSTFTKANKKEIILDPTSFEEIFNVPNWKDFIIVLEKLEPPLIDEKLDFIGSSRGGKGIICSWISTLQSKGKIKSSIKRQVLSSVLNNEIKGLELGKDGSTFSKINIEYQNKWEKKLLKLAGLLP